MRALTVVDEPSGPALVAAVHRALDGGPALAPLPRGLPAAERERLQRALRPDRGVDPTVALVIATSGSTGAPKGVELTAAALEASARAGIERLQLDATDRWLACLPLSSAGGLQVLIRGRFVGSDPLVLPRFDVEAVNRAAEECDGVALVPTMLLRLLDAGVDLTRSAGRSWPAPIVRPRANGRSATVS
jgi:O-succinylbenzoic acid--CoA ligase